MSSATGSTWRVRHEGSPRSIDNLALQDVVQGLEDRQWEPTDEVRGPNDDKWVAIENHPLLEEVAADLEPPPPRDPGEPSHVDMTALIDVCLVLLVFFILTTSYVALSKRLDVPDVTSEQLAKKKPIAIKDAKKTMVLAEVKMVDGNPVYFVEENQVTPDRLTAELERYISQKGKNILLLQYDDEVPHGAVVKVQDAASGARMSKVMLALPTR